jgi:phage recombination protein Bet
VSTPAVRRPDELVLGRYEQLVALREQLAPKATDAELVLFAQVCTNLDLNPFADQIVLVGRWDKRVGREVHRHQVTVAGRRAIAERTGELVGIVGPEWCGPRDARGELAWLEVWDDDVPPYCARVFVHRKGWVAPANGTAKWSEFVVTNQDGKPGPLWARMPSHMLGKVAESLALRRAFPDVITGDVVGAYVGPDAVDLAELAEADPVSVTLPWDTETGEALEAPGAGPPPEAPAPALEGYPMVGDLLSTTDWWTERARRAGTTPARLLTRARGIALELDVAQPREVGEITDQAIVNVLLAWLDDVAQEPFA